MTNFESPWLNQVPYPGFLPPGVKAPGDLTWEPLVGLHLCLRRTPLGTLEGGLGDGLGDCLVCPGRR